MSMGAPRVIGQFAQPKSPGATPRERREYAEWLKMGTPAPQNGQLVTIAGRLAAPTQHKHHGHFYEEEYQTVTGTLGTEGVTVTDGWAKWAKVPRRQRTALTILEGYEPTTITVPLLLDTHVAVPSNAAGEKEDDIEQFVNRIEWMGGRGTLYKGEPGKDGEGETPLLTIASSSALVPNWLQQGKGGGLILWVVEKIEANTLGREYVTPLRREHTGRRSRQALTLTLIEYTEAPNAKLDSAAGRVNVLRKQEHEYQTFTVGDGVNTFTRIARHFNRSDPKRIPDAAREIQRANTKYGASVNKPLPRGAKIRVPVSATGRRL